MPLVVDWERYPQDLLDQEGMMDQCFADWMDEYGRNIHHRPAINLKEAAKPPARAVPDRVDELDELYDQQILIDDYSSSFDESMAQEVYS
jgi:hypothetical protein